MLAILLFSFNCLFGYIITSYLGWRHFKKTDRLAIAFFLGTFLTTWLIFLIASLGIPLNQAILLTCSITICLSLFLLLKTKRAFFVLKLDRFDYLLLFFSLTISIWIMTQTLGHQNDLIKIGADVWGDMELHLPLARSFSWGKNIPPESPFFPNKNLAYHFLFDFSVAILEFLGMKLDVAFNLLGTFSFAFLIILIFNFAQKVFKKNRLVGLVSIFLFLFNGSFGFLDAFRKISPRNLSEFLTKIWQNTRYLSVHPFQDDLVSICWNLNVYVNQRHFVFTMGCGLLFLYWLLYLFRKNKKSWLVFILLGVFWGLLPFWYTHIFISLGAILGVFFIFKKNQRKQILVLLLVGTSVAIPQILWLTKDVQNTFSFQPGFLAAKSFSWKNLAVYWFYNLGLANLTIPLGFLVTNKKQKKLFLAFFSIFIMANLFQFNQEMFNNHKFFNFWLILANFYTAFLLVSLIKKGLLAKTLVCFLLFFLSFSGIIDLMVIKNQNSFLIPDAPKNQLTNWVKNFTPPEATFLAFTDEMYHPVRMAGRKTFQGWPRYAWAYGYDTQKRKETFKSFFKINDIVLLKKRLLENQIDYIIIPKQIPEELEIQINYLFWQKHFKEVYRNDRIEILKIQ